jgi:glycogen operon protein
MQHGSDNARAADAALRPGRPAPLGATWDGSGTNFALVSRHAEAVELCLFDTDDNERRLPLAGRTGSVWHGYLPGVAPGQRYGYRVHGRYEPAEGHRFNPAKLLIDPYAKAIEGRVRYGGPRVFAFPPGRDGRDVLVDREDDQAAIPKGLVVDPAFEWEGDTAPAVPWPETVIYELHVKGFTMRNAAVPAGLRGTYAGLASDASIAYLRALGVTAVELLPIHQIADESFLQPLGLTNYWGYSSVGYFAPNASYASRGGDQLREFKAMVRSLHAAGIEVILDVVFNHTAEGPEHGPTLSLRGIDNALYYRLLPGDPARYLDLTGTGHTLDATQVEVLALIMDSLRYWVEECHVDGFRFDLAPTLAREPDRFDPGATFLDLVYQDPVLARVKLIAEPWDLGPDGFQLGRFAYPWREWNSAYRDAMRDFWRSRASLADFAMRFSGSSDLFAPGLRPASSSINFVTVHDGFTLTDLVSYEHKHNDANEERNLDGTNDNRSWNLGVEGPTDDPTVVALRARQRRNFLATLLLSQGVPLLLAGDEIGRTQGGNNNAWCQDNETSWLDWETDEERRALLAFTRRLIGLRRSEPVFRRDHFFKDGATQANLPDIWWFRLDGRKLSAVDWQRQPNALGIFLNGEAIGEQDDNGEQVSGDSFVLLVNATPAAVSFKLPPTRFGRSWTLELTTEEPAPVPAPFAAGAEIPLEALSIVLLRRFA